MIDKIAIVKNVPSCLKSQLEVWWRSAWHALRSHCRTNPWCPNTLGTLNPNHQFSTKIAVELHFSRKWIVGIRIYLHFVRMIPPAYGFLKVDGGGTRWRSGQRPLWRTSAGMVVGECGGTNVLESLAGVGFGDWGGERRWLRVEEERRRRWFD